MDIAYLSPNSIKIKGKQTTILVNPMDAKGKQTGDTTLLLGTLTTPEFFSPDTGVIFEGAGEYEVKGTKITGFRGGDEVMYTITLDGMSVFVGNATSAEKTKDKLHEHDAAIIFANEVLSQGVMGVLNANVFVFVGEKIDENAKAFGKEATMVNKYSVTKDKLPAEKEFVFLG